MPWPLYMPTAALTFAVAVGASAASPALGAEPGRQTLDETFAPYAELLDRHLFEKALPNGGLVSAFDYQAALDHPETEALLQEQDQLLALFDRASLDERQRAVAFWLNAYNYFMLAHILSNPRNGELVGSVRDYGHLFNPYRVFSQNHFDIGGRKFSLSEIENEILLGDDYRALGWKDARVHFAVNCASVGCPPLRTELYRPDNVDALLAENTRRALRTPRHFELRGDTLYLTELFDWYEEHFVAEQGSVKAWLRAHGEDAVVEAVDRARRIRHTAYDWQLNRPENFPEFSD
ncbi:DUF547 domain-containing protein [Alkalilimnicola ehrlichii]|uniref:DUF547 domain-containing protein n=1 Tax=Alkalilimnicola ehrlichii TaxID=351052 RepID=UPI003B9FC794